MIYRALWWLALLTWALAYDHAGAHPWYAVPLFVVLLALGKGVVRR